MNDWSAGKPKDRDRRACYGLIEVRSGRVDEALHRVACDVAAVASAIRANDLPDLFAEQLELGGITA